MLKNMQEYAKAQKQTKGVFIPEPLLKNLPITTAALLAQLVYWHLPAENGESKLRVKKVDKETGEATWWIAKRRDEWKAECGISAREYDKAIQSLKELGLVETRLYRFNGIVMTHIRLLEEQFLNQYNKWVLTQEQPRFDEKCKIGEENKTPGNPEFTQNVNSDKPSNGHDLTKNVNSEFTQNVNPVLRKVLNQNLRKSEPLNRDYTEITNKEYPYYIKGGSASLSESACPPAVTNNTNDSIPGEVATINGEGLSLKVEKDNAVSSSMMSPSDRNTIVVTPPSNIEQQTKDGIEQREQFLPSGHQQPGINNNSTAAASSQNLPEEKTLREWLAANCRIQWIIDAALSKLDGDQIMPREHTPDWDAMMQQVAAALPTLRDVIVKCGIHPDNLTTLERFCRDKGKPFSAETVIGTLCGPSAKDKLMVYILTEDYI